jgi:hypothetical protein
MLLSAGWRTLDGMTVTFDTQTTAEHPTDAVRDEPIVLEVGLLFQPSPFVERARRLASGGVAVVVSMPVDDLDRAPLTGTSRRLLEVAAENRLREALHSAGYRFVTRRAVPGCIVLHASV